MDIRKFEIEFYWKRATYFWTFTAAAIAGYTVIQRISDEHSRGELSLLLVCLGVIFSLAWYLVNRGSKFWQNNWERHVDMLEDATIGPLYKIILSEEDSNRNIARRILTDTGTFSVTKINQILSFFILLVLVFKFYDTIIIIYNIYIIILDEIKQYENKHYHKQKRNENKSLTSTRRPIIYPSGKLLLTTVVMYKKI